jgi:selenocysteine lyase/cysteine desulfurase
LSALVTVAFAGWETEAPRLVAALRAKGINTSAATSGPGPFNADGAPGTSMLRISPHYFNTEDEMDHALELLEPLRAATATA